MLFGLCVIALAVMFRGSAVGLGSIFVMFGCFIVFVSSRCIPPASVKGKLRKTERRCCCNEKALLPKPQTIGGSY